MNLVNADLKPRRQRDIDGWRGMPGAGEPTRQVEKARDKRLPGSPQPV
jgi:hypothetical protein